MPERESMDQISNFTDILENYKKQIWPIIDRNINASLEFDNAGKVADKYKYLVDFHRKMVRVYPERKGKYVRPSLVAITAQAMGVPLEKALQTAAAMQVSEEWILIHDDVEDDSLQRRGDKALHQMYGKELAINAGDALHVVMWKLLVDNRKVVGEDKAFKVIDEFSQMLDRTVLGQTIEIKWTQDNKTDLSDEDILLILESKTGYYTIAGPMRLGAVLAGASKSQLVKIYEFGKSLGYCFQIKDDLLDLTSDFAGLKKQMGNDIYEGKRTIMLAHLLRTAKGANKNKLLKILQENREQKTEAEVEWTIEQMEKYGSLEYGQKLMEKFAKKAVRYFGQELNFLDHQPYRTYLSMLPDFLLKRTH